MGEIPAFLQDSLFGEALHSQLLRFCRIFFYESTLQEKTAALLDASFVGFITAVCAQALRMYSAS